MATRRITLAAWIKAIARAAPTGDGFDDIAGKPIADVVKQLRVSKQRVHQLIEEGRLDTVEITTASGVVAMTIVTDASLAKYAPRPSGAAGHLTYSS